MSLHHRPFITTVFVSAAFGLAAGAVGMLVVTAYLVPAESPSLATPSTRVRVAIGAPENLATMNPARSAVLFFDRAPAKKDAFSSLVPSASFGAGFVLTSDGWLLAHAESFPKGRDPKASVAVIGTKTYPVTEAVKDPFTGALFLKIDASNLPVTAFGDSESLAQGSVAYAFDVQGGVHRLGVAAIGNATPAAAADFLSSSERVQKVVRLSGVDSILPGSMVLSRDGEISAILAGSDAGGAYAVPFESFSGVIGGVLRERKATRPLLGIRYVDLSRVIGVDDHGVRGALVSASPDGKLPAVSRGSPAGLAGLVAGDIIAAVNGEEVSAKTALADLLVQYAPGSQIILTVINTTGERKVSITLGTVLAP